MDPTEILNFLFQYSLLHLYAPVVNTVGFSHPLTFVIIVSHNTFSLTYLLFTVAVAYPVFHRKTWLVPAAVAAVWVMISLNVITALNISVSVAVAAVLPHGWLEFAAVAYWTNAIRKTAQNSELLSPTGAPAFKDYFRALTKPKKFVALAKIDVQASLAVTKLSLKTFCRNLKRAYLLTLVLIVVAALIETFVTPHIMLFVHGL
ncbi:MAG: hypothetical protein ACLFU9_07255 [Candidatus Bathyarchaeia archaeon]